MGRARVKKAKKTAPRTAKPSAPAPWPDRQAASSLGIDLREQLDYLAWIGETAEAVGFHSGETLGRWREAAQRAYDALVDPMVSEHGDPLPPDVPPAMQPGTWPDVPAARVQGMTVRHQLTVMRTISVLCRGHVSTHHNPAESDRWAARVQAAVDAMDHGASPPMPDSARTRPPGAKAPSGKKKETAAAKASKPPPAKTLVPKGKPAPRPLPAARAKKPARKRR
jgi:hypothetical protein